MSILGRGTEFREGNAVVLAMQHRQELQGGLLREVGHRVLDLLKAPFENAALGKVAAHQSVETTEVTELAV